MQYEPKRGTCLAERCKSHLLSGIALSLISASWPASDAMRRALPESARESTGSGFLITTETDTGFV